MVPTPAKAPSPVRSAGVGSRVGTGTAATRSTASTVGAVQPTRSRAASRRPLDERPRGRRPLARTARAAAGPGTYDAIVVGGGPGGATAACFLSREGLRVLLLEKERFPRDKPCGDAISGKSASVLRELGLADRLEEREHLVAEGVIFSSPKGEVVRIPFPQDVDPSGLRNSKRYHYVTSGYLVPRLSFDDLLFQHAKRQEGVTAIERFAVTGMLREGGRVVGVAGTGADGARKEFRAPVVVGADGALSVVAKEVGAFERDHDHWIGAFRIYYEDVAGLSGGDIEIHFHEDLIPGYFWIFPLGNGRANVGAGMIETDLRSVNGHKVNLKETTYRLLREHPMFQERFAGAREVPGSFRGWLLPLGSKRRPVAGDGWVLVGDAASLIDPFSGEGIGNAMVSARLAARRIAEAHRAGDFSKAVLARYEADLRAELDEELQTSYKLQKLGRRTWLLNYVLHRASRSEAVRGLISSMLADRDKKEQFGNLWFYAKLLVR